LKSVTPVSDIKLRFINRLENKNYQSPDSSGWIYGFVHELKHMTGMQFGAVPLAGHAKPP